MALSLHYFFDLCSLLVEVLSVGGVPKLEALALALLEEVDKLALDFVAEGNPVGVGQVERSLVLVHVDKVRQAHLSKGL